MLKCKSTPSENKQSASTRQKITVINVEIIVPQKNRLDNWQISHLFFAKNTEMPQY